MESQNPQKMKLFVTIHNSFISLGIDAPEPLKEFKMFNFKNAFVLGFIATFFLCSVAYVVFDAETRAEYGDGIYAITIALANTCILAMINVKAGACFELIAEFKAKVQMRKINLKSL